MYSDQDIANLVTRVQQLEIQVATMRSERNPNIKLLSPNFLTRAFAVWGNHFVASLIIGVAFSCVLFLIGLLIGTSAITLIRQILSSYSG
jgi:hypothetical protein